MSGPAQDASLEAMIALLREAKPAPRQLERARNASLSSTSGWFMSGLGVGLGAAQIGVALTALFGALALSLEVRPRDGVEPPVADDKARASVTEPLVEVHAAPLVDIVVVEAPTIPSAFAKPSAPAARLVVDVPLQLDVGTPPTVAYAPSATLANGLRAYASERYGEAARMLQEVAEGRTNDGPQQIMQADFFLAKCLFHLGLFHASAAAFDEVTRRGPEHRYFEESLGWLAMLSRRVPEPRAIIESVARYSPAQLATLDRDGTREHLDRLRYLMGRARYRELRFDEAIPLFASVNDSSELALEARFFEGIAHVRQRRARPAMVSFQRVIAAVQRGETGGHAEPERMSHLASMSLARLYYSAAMRLPARRDDRASELLSGAIAHWRRIPLRSEYWLDSFFEETWALYIGGEYARALGHIHALESPFFADRANPEALVLRAMMQFEHCQWDAVEHSLAHFHQRYDPVMRAAARAERMADTHHNAFRMLVAVRRDRSRAPRAVVPALRAAFSDREIIRQLRHIGSIDRELDRLGGLDTELLESSVGARVRTDLAVIRALEVDRAGEMATERTRRLADELRERMQQMDTVELELATQRRAELEHPNRLAMGPAEGGRVIAVQGDQVWPWDGEWWVDEIPFYYQEIRNRCGH